MTNPRTLKELIKKNDDELSFGGYTEDMLQECAKRLIAEWRKEAHKTLDHKKSIILYAKVDAFREFFGVL